jgi:hypothetical protein
MTQFGWEERSARTMGLTVNNTMTAGGNDILHHGHGNDSINPNAQFDLVHSTSSALDFRQKLLLTNLSVLQHYHSSNINEHEHAPHQHQHQIYDDAS